MKLPVFKAFSASLAYFGMRVPEVIRTSWLPLLVLHIAMIILLPRYMEPMLQMQSIDPEADPTAALSAIGPALKWIGLLYLTMAITYPMLIAGHLRPIIRGESSSLPFSFQFGKDELFILASFILWIGCGIVVYLVGAIALMAVTIALSAVSPAIGGIAGGLGVVAYVAAVIWFMLRMSLIFPATIAEQKIGLPHSWSLTKGASWSLFFYWLLWMVIFVVLAFVYFLISMPDYFSVMGEMIAAGQDEAAQQAAALKINRMQLEMWDISNPGAWFNVAFSFVYMLITIAMWNIAAGTAYRYLTDAKAGE